ncbi:LolA family protein [Oleisolibacter albus]|uniref:LolA family protein n=1 Tax=Oleisolibacter albus TaxID=2171757 RepID=UPI000DF32EB7|nr:outer membrane lipoprotein carrier protein LolA [Oleisolibacter albus]
MRTTLTAVLALTATLSLLPPLLAPQPALAAAKTAAVKASAAKGAPALTDQDRADLKQVEDYLNGITSLKSEFLQVTDDGKATRGTFSLLRPGRMRIDYEPPVRNFIVADGSFVYFWDAELKEQSNAPIGSTLADFLLRPQIVLSGDVTVTDITRDGGTLEVTLVQTKDPGLGRLTLVFEQHPFALRKWRVLDAQGLTTQVALMSPEFGVTLDPGQFYFRDPGRRRERD